MPDSLRVRSFAKINLDLRVLHKRPDGFHELRTIFQTISLADTIEIECQRGRTRIEIESNIDILDNLIVKAAEAVLKAAKTTGRLQFRLTKRIPLGSGLGGGSSNAAAVLLALPVMLGKPLPLEKLLELSAELGSDIPFSCSAARRLVWVVARNSIRCLILRANRCCSSRLESTPPPRKRIRP